MMAAEEIARSSVQASPFRPPRAGGGRRGTDRILRSEVRPMIPWYALRLLLHWLLASPPRRRRGGGH